MAETAVQGRDLSKELFGETAPTAPVGRDLSKELFGTPATSAPTAPVAPSPAPSPAQPGAPRDIPGYDRALAPAGRNPLSPGVPLPPPPAPADDMPAVGSRQVMTPRQMGIPEPMAPPGTNPLAPRHEQPVMITPELSSQGYGTGEQALRNKQVLPWLKARATQPQVWGQAADTGARVVGGILTGGASLPIQAGTQMATEAAAQAVGLQPVSPGKVLTAGATEVAGNILPQLALKSFQWMMGQSRGAKQLTHDTRMTAVQQEAARAKEPLQAALDEEAQISREAGLQSRELRPMREGVFAGVKEQLGKKAEALKGLAARAQAGTRAQLGKTSGADIEQIVRTAGHWGPEVSDEAVNLAYRQLDDTQGLFIPRQKLDAAVNSLPPPVRQALAEPLSAIPMSKDGAISFGQLRAVQSQVGKSIRALEQAEKINDVNAPARLKAMKEVYASTFEVLDDAIASGRAFRKQYSPEGPPEIVPATMPADTKQLLEDANKLNRTLSLIDRVGLLGQTYGIRTVGGDDVFDADRLLRAIKGDGFLTRMLKQEGAYDNLVESLGRIATAQKTKFAAEGFDPSGMTKMQQQMRRQETLRTVDRERASGELKQATELRMGTIDEQMKAAQDRIAREAPDQQGRYGWSDVGSPVTKFIGVPAIGRFLLSTSGRDLLEKLFAADPRITTPKLGFLLNASGSAEEERKKSK